MSAYKQFLASDVIVTPFEVNKNFTFKQSEFSGIGIDRFLGTSGYFISNKTATGTLSSEYSVLVYSSVKELYYSNFLSSSVGDPAQVTTVIPGVNRDSDRLTGPNQSTGYFNYLQTSLSQSRFFPTGSAAEIAVFSIPSSIFGTFIKPGSFILDYSSSFKAYDDGEGNLYSSASFAWDTGQIEYFFYSESADLKLVSVPTSIELFTAPSPPSGYTFASASWLGDIADTPFRDSGGPISAIDDQGVSISGVTLSTDTSVYTFQNTVKVGPIELLYVSSSSIINSVSASENVGNIIYPHGMAIFTNQNLPLSSITTLANTTCSFQSTVTIYETQYKCTISENESNYSLNPSLNAGLDGLLYTFATASFFSPYITTVGLYNDEQELVAVAKLAQPVPTSATTDMSIIVNLDM